MAIRSVNVGEQYGFEWRHLRLSSVDKQAMLLQLTERRRTALLRPSLSEATDCLATEFSLTEEEKNRLLPSGTQPIFYNRVGWARTYLKQAALLEATRRNYLRITDRGRKLLESNPPKINMKFLEQFPEYIEFRDRKREMKDR